MDANELRTAFTEFFTSRGHQKVPSGSLIPHDDTLLFTNAGMVPFKSYFLGEEQPPLPRVTTVQKCVRAGGKHNDLDEVGRTSRHLTFFEMLGNFSFGDYFKETAIPLAWEFFTTELGLDPERLWVTVHLTDDEAADIWHETVGVPRERIQRLDEDNWWRMADTGPNGPCSEIFWDKGPQYGPDGGPENPEAEDRFIEIWNLVFMQFDQQPDGTQVPLPKPSIDTGAGLERIVSVLQGVDSVWSIDEFQKLLAAARDITGVAEPTPEQQVSLQIIADHARSSTFLINDEVVPSNEDRGFVLRRIIRRAVRHAHILGVEEPVMAKMVDVVIGIMGEAYPGLDANKQNISDALHREEVGFRKTISSGSTILENELGKLTDGQELPGDVAFQLHDTYGFPLELTEEITRERGIEVDRPGFDVAMAEQRNRAKADQAAKTGGATDTGVFVEVLQEHGATAFTGRDESSTVANVLLVTDDAIVVDRTPFYAESGGQIGDTGIITTATGTARVLDTVYGAPGLHRHVVEIDGVIEAGQEATLTIDDDRRAAIKRHHTATHLLHSALRRVLGDHVKQQGSWVGPERLRFDFSHFEPVTREQLQAIEDLTNADILANPEAKHFETSMAEAQELGAIAFFGDKYGDVVRVLDAGPNSIELCGGTHVGALGDIGLVKIVSEGSIGSNLRRIEAVAGTGSVELLRAEEDKVIAAAQLIGVPTDDLLVGIERRLNEMKELQAELKAMRSQAAAGTSTDLVKEAVDGVVVARVDGVSRDDLREIVTAIRDQDGIRAAVVGSALDGGGVALVAAVTDDSGLEAAALIADGAKLIKGGGGKGKDFAMAGGKDADGIDPALDAARAAAGL